jgi:pyruvate dehydrogenase E2 component (dihydrolipoamide acetyltransferase)
VAVEFRLPELGENIDSGDLVRILVSVGDAIVKDQPVIELETDKATIEVPSTVSGRIKKVHVKQGAKVKVGDVILTVEDDAETKEAAPAPEEAEKKAAKKEAKPAKKAEAAPAEKEKKETRKEEAKPAAKVAPAKAEAEPEAEPEKEQEEAPAAETAEQPAKATAPAAPSRAGAAAPASPSVRRLARELGVDVTDVAGSSPGGRISVEDVKLHAKSLIQIREAPRAAAGGAVQPLPDFSRWGEAERQPMSNVRRKTAQHLAHAWSVAPQVTQYDRADVTALEEMRKELGPKAEEKGGKLTVTAVALKIVAKAIADFPQFVGSVDLEREEIILKKYVHIGIAVDTDRGLLVPVIRDVDKKDLFELAVEVTRVAEKARNRKLTPDDLAGGVFTITNLGGIGGTGFSPIVNWPEVAILGLARASQEPVWQEDRFVPRLILPLSLSYDHRLIDGADAARFLRRIAESFEKPFQLFA